MRHTCIVRDRTGENIFNTSLYYYIIYYTIWIIYIYTHTHTFILSTEVHNTVYNPMMKCTKSLYKENCKM